MAEWWRQLSDGISGFAEQLVQQANSAQQDIEREHQRLATERAAERIKQVGKIVLILLLQSFSYIV